MKTADNESFGFFWQLHRQSVAVALLAVPGFIYHLEKLRTNWQVFPAKIKDHQSIVTITKAGKPGWSCCEQSGIEGSGGRSDQTRNSKTGCGWKVNIWRWGIKFPPPPVSPLRNADRSDWDQVRQGWSTESRAPFWEFWSNALFKWKVYFFRGSVFGTLYFWSWKRFIFGALYFCIKQAS